MNDDRWAIEAHGLTRYFGKRAVVRDMTFAVPRGAVVGLLGPNGAGKTTAIRLLLGLLDPTRGTSKILGQDSQSLTPETRSRIGFTGENHFLYSWMRVREAGTFAEATFNKWDARLFHETIERFGVELSAKVRWLSRGQRAGVSLASTLAACPDLLILDDPALGLDPVSRRALNETLIDFCAAGQRTVLLSTHLLDDVERVADRVAILVNGSLIVDTTLDDLRSRVCVWSVDGTFEPARSHQIPGLVHCRTVSGRWLLVLANPDEAAEAAVRRAGATHIDRLDAKLEDIVMAYLSRSRTGDSFYAGVR